MPFKELLCALILVICLLNLSKRKYKKVMKVYDFKDNQIACIGDQTIF